MTRLMPGLKLLECRAGSGPSAKPGDNVTYEVSFNLNRGDEVPLGSAPQTTKLGTRRVIAGVEKALIGMRSGGYRKVRVSPHLAYGARGVEGSIPANAVLFVSLWLLEIRPASPGDEVR
jgi:FKBP-type peptidyl-prolyl cis-trans isomerase